MISFTTVTHKTLDKTRNSPRLAGEGGGQKPSAQAAGLQWCPREGTGLALEARLLGSGPGITLLRAAP